MYASTDNLEVKKAQLEDLKLVEAYKRSNAVKTYEVLSENRHQLPIPEKLVNSVRLDKKPVNVCKQLFDRGIMGKIIQEDVVACLNPDLTVIVPTPILPKPLNVSCHEIQNLANLTVETKMNRASWLFTAKKYNELKLEANTVNSTKDP